jgi:hypothetical protein
MNYAFTNPFTAMSAADDVPRHWRSAAQPPEIYDLVELRFADGKSRRGTWNGKIWWGYDDRVRRSGVVEPVAWRPLT